jgi:hypothetical protein
MEPCTGYIIQRQGKHDLSRLAGTRPRSWHHSSTWRGAAPPGTRISVFQESIIPAIRANALQIISLDWINGFHMDGPVITARGSSCRTRQLAGCRLTSGLARNAASWKVSGWDEISVSHVQRGRGLRLMPAAGSRSCGEGLDACWSSILKPLHGMQVTKTTPLFYPPTNMLLRRLESEVTDCWPLKSSTMNTG